MEKIRRLISDEYLEMNRAIHRQYIMYGMSGHRWAPKVAKLARIHGAESILDYGCGKGTLRNALIHRNYGGRDRVFEYDPAVDGKRNLPDPADLVVCCDVLEHIEPEFLDDVLNHIRQLAKRAVFGVVATRPAKKLLPDGRNAHLIIQPMEWWMGRLSERWRLVELGKDASQPGEFLFVGIPFDCEGE